MRGLKFLALLTAIMPIGAYAQTSANVVSACGSPNSVYTSGSNSPVTQDTTGKLCTSGSGGGGGGSVTQGTVPWVDQLAAGSNIIGYVDIDQTTPGTTNGVTIAPTSASSAAITPVVSSTAEASHVLKASAGNVYSATATNLTSTAGFFVLLNSTTPPSDGSITPLACAFLPGNGSTSITYNVPPANFSTGVTAVVTSASTCFTKTTGTITAMISGVVQ